ncbi:DUF2807 domain-containing protein [Marinilabilia sp.]|uniref:GIN domain-containing protein n=1 Tax=Marinilabilia sp. TaxID=2021252 RepID=UPI0025B96CC6|nr:DUF2807 domain-containing protein [Marinilabilia sp.]
MFRFLLRNIGLWILLIAISSCDEILTIAVVGDGNLKTEERNLSSFSQILLESSDFELILRSGGKHKVVVETDSNLMSYVTTETSGNQLLIDTKINFNIQAREGVKITVYYPGNFLNVEIANGGILRTDSLVLDRFNISIFGVSKMRTVDTLRCSDLNLFSDGSTNVLLTGLYENLTVHQQGSGNILLLGRSSYGDLLLEGSGKIDCRELMVHDADLELYGSGLILCSVSGRLSAEITGNGRIYYYGMPETLVKNIEGDGLVLPGN